MRLNKLREQMKEVFQACPEDLDSRSLFKGGRVEASSEEMQDLGPLRIQRAPRRNE